MYSLTSVLTTLMCCCSGLCYKSIIVLQVVCVHALPLCVQRLVNEWVLRFNCFENLAVQVWGESLMAYVQMGLTNVTLHSSGGLVSVTHFLFFLFFFF